MDACLGAPINCHLWFAEVDPKYF